jgi:hypothetical protein
MTTWVIISWIFVAILTGVNVFVFLKLKTASDQMMKMAFPNAKNSGDAMAQAQQMMAGMGMGGAGGGKAGAQPDMGALMQQMNNPKMQQQMKQAMEMLSKMQQNGKGPRR